MDNDPFTSIRRPEQGNSNTISLFLALYLLILAFFILLVSISSTEAVKAKAVMQSLSSAFDGLIDPWSDPTSFTGDSGDKLGGHDFQVEITALFSTALQVAKVEVIRPGRMLRVRVPVREVFVDGEARVRPSLEPLLDRIVASMSGPPPGVEYEAEVVMDAAIDGKGMLSAERSLRTERAVAFVDELLARGLPRSSLGIGLTPEQRDEVIINFHVRPIEQARLEFSGVRPIGEAASSKAPPPQAVPGASPPAASGGDGPAAAGPAPGQ